MFGTKRYELPLGRNYVAQWTMVQAVREFIQNSLDSESPFVYEFIDQDSTQDEGQRWTLRLNSEFTTLPASTLLLGSTSKADSADSIGSFGEGYKVALLVLTREGYPVEMLNGDVRWTPAFRHSRIFNAEVLSIEETALTDKINQGLTVLVYGLTDDERSSVEAICLKMQREVGAVKDTKFGRILLERPGKLYVGSLFICDTDLKFGYDVEPKHMRLERDRQTVNGWELAETTTKMWFDTGEVALVAKLINDDVPDVADARWNMPEIIRDEVYQQFTLQNPGVFVAQSQQEQSMLIAGQLKDMVARGMTKAVYVGGGTYHAFNSHPLYKPVPPPTKLTPKQVLANWYEEHRVSLTEGAKADWAGLMEKAQFWEWK